MWALYEQEYDVWALYEQEYDVWRRSGAVVEWGTLFCINDLIHSTYIPPITDSTHFI